MFEAVIAALLKGYVARYVDINADQLSVQLLYGRPIVVENLTFNKTTLNNDIRKKLKLPIEIESLHVGKIQCSFLWSSLFFRSSAPALTILIEHVRAIIKPVILDDNEDPQEEFTEENEIAKKRNHLDLSEQQLEKEFEYLGEVKSSSWSIRRLVLSFLEKLQVQIIDLHISYESFTSDNIPYTVGLSFDNIQISNELSNENMNRKTFQIHNLALYIDSNTSRRDDSSTHSYILLPSNSITIYLTRNYIRSALINRQQPRYELEWTFNDLSLKSSVDQVRILSDVIRFIHYSNTHRKFINDPSRPTKKISKTSVKLWWRYITLVIIRTQNYLKVPISNDQKHTTTNFWFNSVLLNKRLKQIVIYKRLYRLYLDNKYLKRSTISNFTSADRLILNDIEMDFDLDCLTRIRRVIFRTRANEQLSLANNSQQQSTNMESASSWYMSYANWISSKTVDLWKTTTPTDANQATTISTTPIISLNENDEKLQEQVNTFIAQSLEDQDLAQNRRDALYLRLKFLVKSVQIDLLSNSDIMFHFSLDNVSVLIELRPRYQSLLFYLRLDDLNICDRFRTDAFSNIVCPKQRPHETSVGSQRAPVIEVSYETNPRSQKPKERRLSFSLAVRSRGLCFVCCPISFERLRDFFASAFIEPSSMPLSSSSSSSSSIFQHWTHLKDRTAKQLKSAFEQIFSQTPTKMTSSNVKDIRQGQRRHKKKFDIYLDICAPQMIVPQSSDRALIMDFGYLTFINDEYKKSSCPLKNCNMHTNDSLAPLSINTFFQQRPYFFTEQNPSATVEDDDEEFVTPDSSPTATDNPLEFETTNYPINNIPREQRISPTHDDENLIYTPFSLSLCDMQLGYLTYSNNQSKNNLSSIIEKFGFCFLIQYRTIQTFDLLWPLIKVSGTLPKIIIHLDPSRLETLCGTINNWGSFIENLTSTIVSNKSDIKNNQTTIDDLTPRLALSFSINEISVQLSDDSRALSEVRIQNIDLTLINHINSNNLSFSVHTLMIVDAIQNHGKDYELLLTSNRALDINTQTGTLYESHIISSDIENEYLIRINIQSLNDVAKNEICLKVDIQVNKLHFVFNPETLSILINFIVNIIYSMKTILRQNYREENKVASIVKKNNRTKFQINSEFQELSILCTNVLTKKLSDNRFIGSKLEKIAAATIKQASLNIFIESSTMIEAEICSLQIFNLLPDSLLLTYTEESSAIVNLGIDEKNIDHDEVFPSKAFYLLYKQQKDSSSNNNIEDLLIKMASVCYTHSPKILYKIEKVFDYMAEHCHSTAAIQMEKMKKNVIKQGSMLLNQYVLSTESVLETEKPAPQLNLNIILATPILIFRPQSKLNFTNNRLVFHLGDIHIENSENHASNYEIKINGLHFFSIDLEHEFRHNQGINLLKMYKNPHLTLHILDNLSIHLNLNLTDTSITIDSKLVSSVQMFLGKQQITLLQNIISSLTYNENDEMNEMDALITNLSDDDSLLLFDEGENTFPLNEKSLQTKFKTFAVHFQLPELTIVFLADLDLKPTKVCEAVFEQFQMSIEQRHRFCKNVSLRLNSLHINDCLIKTDQCLFSTRCRKTSTSISFSADHKISSSFPRETYHMDQRFSSNSVPTYMVTNESSTWTLKSLSSSSSATSLTTNSSAPSAFIDINITVMDKRHELFDGFCIKADAQFGEVDIKFIISTWVMLFDIIGLIGGGSSPAMSDNRESKEFKPTSDTDFMQINIQVDAVSCLLQDNDIPPIRISLQRFDCQIQNFLTIEKALKTLMIHGKLGSVSIYDLSPFGQLYGERFCTSGTNALVFTYTKQEDLIPITSSNFLSRLQLYLRMTSVQYIHTQRFLMDLIHFFDRFHHDQECYNRIRSAAAGQTISFSAGRSTGIELDIEAESPVLILPEYALNKRVIILHLGNIIIKNRFLFENEPGTLSSIMNKPKVSTCLLDVISIQFQDTLLYSAVYSKSDSNTQLTVKFSDFGFHTIHNDLSSMLRESCYLNIHVERNLDNSLNHASPTYSVKADLSSIDILLDTYQYSLIRGILAYNIGEPLEQPARLAMMNDDPLCVSTILTGDAYLDLLFIVQMDNVGFEIFIPQESKRNSLGYCAFIKSYFSFEKYSNNNQVLDLTCSSIKLNDTRTENNNSNEFRDILTSSSSKSTSKSNMQLEIHLLTTKTDDKYTVVLNHTRVLFIVDWLLKLNDFLSSFQQIPMQSNSSTSSTSIIVQAKKRFEIRLNFNQSELVLVQTTNNQQSNALVLSGIMSLTYREAMRQRPLDCSLFNVTLFSCQMNNIQSTAVSIIEPINITFNIHLTNEKDQHVFEVNLPQLFIRLSYSDVKLMLYMFQSIKSQIYQAQTRDIIPKYQINQPLKRLSVDSEFSIEPSFDDLYTDLRIRSTIAPSNQEKSMSIEEIDNEKQSKLFLNVHSMKFSCEQISLCLIDDCLDANIPLLNLNFASIKLNIIEYGTHRIQQADFQVNIDYYNRLLSGYEPFIEVWPLQMTLKNSTTTKSLSISSNHLLNINYTNTMHQLFDLVKNNWLEDYNSSNDINKEAMYFRRPKPFEPYCFQNLIGQRVKFRTWLSVQQRFDLNDHMVEYNETKSFIFPSEALTAKKNMYNKDFQTSSSSSSSSDRRLLILIEGWDWLQPISIDRVGTFFRLAIPTGDRLQKTMLVFIDVTMTDSSMRLITIRSPIEIRNQLLTPIDIRLKCGSGSLHDIRLEPNETRSLPLQFCPTLRQFQVRPADFTFNYCGEPINWMEIADEKRRRRQQDHESDENSAATETDSLQRHRDINSTDRRSFFRTCTMTGDDTLHFVCIQSKQTRLLAYKDHILSSYQISILPPLIIDNLLPCDLFFQIYSYPHKVRLNPYKSHREHALDICQAIDITFATDLFRMTKPLRVPSINDLNLMRYHRQSVGFYDSIDRLLLVDVTIVCSIRHRLKISVSVPYVLLNKSGIPLIFKQEGSVNEVAGQSHEHELARNREPLLFSFSDQEAFHACVMKVGSGLHENDDGRPIWSQRFSLEHGSSYRQLYVRSPHGSPDWIYYIGIDVRQGKGRLRRTNFIFLSTRYMISNQCSYDLSIAQRHIVRAMLQTGDHSNLEQNCLHVLQHSNVAYHWPRSDLDQLLCVRVINNRQYRHVYWSGGIPINRVNAFHINLRYDNNQCLILRVQVIERGGTFFVVFMDSNQMPAPLRVKNLSDVPIQFYQSDTREELTYLRAFIQPHQSIDYAWDEPTLQQTITCSVVGGTKETYDLKKLGHGENLCYENHICLAFEQTFMEGNIAQYQSKHLLHKSKSVNDRNAFPLFNQQQLVIDYIENKLVLAQREENKRSQLWRMTSSGLLVHTGSSSPRDWSNKNEVCDDIRSSYVLDIEETCTPNLKNVHSMTRFTRLTVRRHDYKRTLTQTWRFHDDGYLCMGETQMCVQVFGELKEKSEVALGPRHFNEHGIILPPLPTMNIRPHRRLQGSGLLSVRTYADGPTRILEIANVKTNNALNTLKSEALALAAASGSISNIDNVPLMSYSFDLRLECGIGISIISSIGHESEELVFMIFNDISLAYKDNNNEQSIEVTIGTIVISNQLLMTTTPCLLYATYSDESSLKSALRLQASLQKPSANYKQLYIFHYLFIGLNGVTIQIDEILLWKLLEFFKIDFSVSSNKNAGKNDDQTYDLDEGEYDTQRLLSLLTSTQATRIYFYEVSILSIDLDLSVNCATSRSLPAHLSTIKRHAPFPLIRFENAPIHLKSYDQVHVFNTYDFFLLALTTHYVDELKRQAFKILGSVDFLGNPLGLFNDVTDGFASLVDHGSVSGLVKSVAHGVADSTSKFTGTLSYGLGKLASDEEHDDMREAIANSYRGSSIGHVIGGTVGLAAGFIGGLTSIITQPYKSVVEDGVGGLMKGVAKGIVGTVSKPMVGILDFANGLAMAVKEGARSSNTITKSRIRTTRCPTNIYGLLQPYSAFDANGQCLLYQMNKGDLTERYITRITVSQKPANAVSRRGLDNVNDDEYAVDQRDCFMHAMITSQRVIIYRTETNQDETDYEITEVYDYSAVSNVVVIDDDNHRPYVEFVHSQSNRTNKMRPTTTTTMMTTATSTTTAKNGGKQYQHSLLRCDLHDRATRLARDIQRAIAIFEEEKFTYIPPDDEDEDDDDIPNEQQLNETVQMT
ncbi:unnamed protein product [Rotaria magnacalcarata]|uniref:Vacuolar protein sorting-associated protein 13D n=8 Tax=Rotaria magnacalcarata TaxID=392030 RepID=A0A816AWK2_9BILA|nr:unnamed protein product [Rotaria magnacalcarata]